MSPADFLPMSAPLPGARVVALREVCRRMIAQGEKQNAVALALGAMPMQDELRSEALAQIGLQFAPLARAQEEKHFLPAQYISPAHCR